MDGLPVVEEAARILFYRFVIVITVAKSDLPIRAFETVNVIAAGSLCRIDDTSSRWCS